VEWNLVYFRAWSVCWALAAAPDPAEVAPVFCACAVDGV